MANTSDNLYNAALAVTTLTTIYTPASNEVGKSLWLTLTNTTTTTNTVDVYIYNGVSDILIEKIRVPRGNGRVAVCSKLSGHSVSGGGGQLVKVQLSSATNINVVLSGVRETS